MSTWQYDLWEYVEQKVIHSFLAHKEQNAIDSMYCVVKDLKILSLVFIMFVGEVRRWDRNSEVITLFLRISLIWRVFLYLQVRNKFRKKAMVDNHYISHNRCHFKLWTSVLERKYRWRWIVDSLRISSNFLTLYFKNS